MFNIHSHLPEMAGGNILKLTFIYTNQRGQLMTLSSWHSFTPTREDSRWLCKADIHLHLPEKVTTFWGWHSFTPTWDGRWQLSEADIHLHILETVRGQSTTMWHWHLFTPTWDSVKTVDDCDTDTYSHQPETGEAADDYVKLTFTLPQKTSGPGHHQHTVPLLVSLAGIKKPLYMWLWCSKETNVHSS